MFDRARFTAEFVALTAAVRSHQAKIDVAAERADALALAFEQVWGFTPSLAPDHAPAWREANEAYEALVDDDGFYWACSRVHDLRVTLDSGRLVTGPSFGTESWSVAHVWGIGDMPRPHASVGPWVLATLDLSSGVHS